MWDNFSTNGYNVFNESFRIYIAQIQLQSATHRKQIFYIKDITVTQQNEVNIMPSERLCYRLMTDKDVDSFYQLDQDPEVMRYINGGKPSSREEIETVYMPRLMSYTNFAKGWGMWRVGLQPNNEFIGWILVRPMQFFSKQPEHHNLELGWRFFRAHWGKGYATEAAIQIMNTLSVDKDIQYFSAVADENNLGSIHIMKKLGMDFVKKYLHKDPLGDTPCVYYQKTTE